MESLAHEVRLPFGLIDATVELSNVTTKAFDEVVHCEVDTVTVKVPAALTTMVWLVAPLLQE